MGGEASRVIRAANALSARIAAYHRGPGSWTGYAPVPPGYCGTMREGEAVMKELARLASRAILYRLPGLALDLQAAGNRLGDALDEEEMINLVAGYSLHCLSLPGGRPALSRARNRALYRRGTDAYLPRASGCAASVVRRAANIDAAMSALKALY